MMVLHWGAAGPEKPHAVQHTRPLEAVRVNKKRKMGGKSSSQDKTGGSFQLPKVLE